MELRLSPIHKVFAMAIRNGLKTKKYRPMAVLFLKINKKDYLGKITASIT